MIFGDRHEFALEVDRLDPPGNPLWDSEAVWGALTVWVDRHNMVEHHRHGDDRLRASVHVPLLGFARWIAQTRNALHYEERSPFGASWSPHDELARWGKAPPIDGYTEDQWFDSRDDWWARHFTGAATADLVVPSLGIVRNDDRAFVSWRAPAMSRPDREFLRPEGARVVSWDVVSHALDDFATMTAAWAPDDASWEPAPTGDGNALSLYTGLPPEAAEAYGFLEAATENPASDPLAQVVRDLTRRTATGTAQPQIVSSVRATSSPTNRRWYELRKSLIVDQTGSFEAVGRDCALMARQRFNLDGQPLDDAEELLRQSDIEVVAESPRVAGSDRMIVAGSEHGSAVTMIFSNSRTETPWGRRFELVRALGHLLMDPVRGGAVGAASGPQAIASRRRRSGAFAAELLLPTSAIAAASHGKTDGILEGDRFQDLLTRYGVSASTAAFQLWNQGLLSSTDVRDDLI